MSAKVNFDQAKQDHLAWKYKMRNFLDGKEDMQKDEVISHLQCRLGKWFYAEGKEEFGGIDAIQKFELKHIKLHKLAKDILELKTIGNIELAEDLYEDLERTSGSIIALLSEAENVINKDIIEEEDEIRPTHLLDKIVSWDKTKPLLVKMDVTGTIEYANQHFLEVSGYQSTEVLGRSCDVIRHPDMPLILKNWVWEELKYGAESTIIVKNLAKSGRYFWVVIDYKPNKNANGEIETITAKYSGFNIAIVQKFIEPLYKQLLYIEKKNGVEASEKYLKGFLEERNRTMEEYTRNLIMTGRDSVKHEKRGFFSKLFNWK